MYYSVIYAAIGSPVEASSVKRDGEWTTNPFTARDRAKNLVETKQARLAQVIQIVEEFREAQILHRVWTE